MGAIVGLLIGDVARRAGVSAPAIRYYEGIGLLPSPARSSTGYRWYTESTVEALRFIRKAQALGFSLDELRDILELCRSGKTPCTQVLSLVRQHLAAVEARIRQLQRFHGRLAAELAKWDGNATPSCRGLCEIIASADAAPADRAVPDLTPLQGRTRKGRRRGAA